MIIPNCVDDFYETLLFVPLVVIAEISLCLILSWNLLLLVACVACDILLFIHYLIDWCYLSRTVILGDDGVAFARGNRINRYSWKEVNIQYVNNTGYFWGDSEIAGDGVIISIKSICKPPSVGAMTYCRFSHPNLSVFIRFHSSDNDIKNAAAKFVYKGFSAKRCALMKFSCLENSLNRPL